MTEVSGQGLAAVLHAHRDEIVPRWIDVVARTARGRITPAELESELGTVFDALTAGLHSGATEGTERGFGEARALIAELSRNRARQGFSPTETAASIFALKEQLLDAVRADDDAEVATEFVAFSRLLDELAMYTFETYVEARNRIIAQQAEEMTELSTPVVKLWDGILAVPLVGTLDSGRTQVVTEKLLHMLVETGSEHAIIDITGVPAVDTQVAQHLLKTVVAARLMGAECIISGIRPQIAQTVVALGIEFGDVATKATLADALSMALHRSGFSIRRVTS
ncbi:MAG: rsbT co-antagonist protein RsbR [Pseudonocardiales bacterium]|nr:rsbT co-antagonist protein RsbR [Pseudonocardiales bacterium]